MKRNRPNPICNSSERSQTPQTFVKHMKTALFAMLLGTLFVSNANALPAKVQLVAVGDGTQFNTWAHAAHVASAANFNYTISGPTPAGAPFAAMLDTRLGAIPPEQGELWVVWDANINNVWCFLKMDSIVAMRGFFASPRTQLLLDPLVQATPGQNLVPGLPPDAPALPAPVFAAINLAFWNASMTGLTPPQALAENTKILHAPAAPPARYGYGPAPLKFPIIGTFPPFPQRTPVVFNIAGVDPITAAAIPPSKTIAMRKSIVVPFVNATNLAPPGGIGSFIVANHNVTEPCGTLSAGLNGAATTTQLFGVALPGNLLNVFLDFPVAGTWYEMESKLWVGCHPVLSQETGVNPPANDPLNLLNAGMSLRERVHGQGGAIAQVGGTPDSIGYVSWTCNALAGVSTYVTVNGQNPFVGPWTGVFPGCVGPAANLAYPLQLPQFVVTDAVVPPGVAALIGPVNAIVTPGLKWQ